MPVAGGFVPGGRETGQELVGCIPACKGAGFLG